MLFYGILNIKAQHMVIHKKTVTNVYIFIIQLLKTCFFVEPDRGGIVTVHIQL